MTRRTLACALSLAAVAAAETVTVGPWSLDASSDGPRNLCFRGQSVVPMTSFTGYAPGWKATRFGLADAELARGVDGRSLTWTKTVAGQATMALTLALEETAATWRVEADVQPSGPCEFGLYLAPSLLAGPDGGVQVTVGRGGLALDEAPFASAAVRDQLAIERPEMSLAWSCSSSPGVFALQDWRAREPASLRLITVMDGGATPARVSASVRLQVTPYDAAAAARRLKTVFQRTRWLKPVAVPNGGFEDGLAGWDHSANASAIEEVAHGGRRAARLVVADPRTDPVYITRQLPVTGGASYTMRCQVRTQGVEAREGKMSSVGAGLIVEWADKDGKWLAAGQYACGLYGDHDWTVRECASLRAPEEAGFAVVFLALRGAGTAWFDDVELVRVHQCVALSEPEPGATLADNTPALSWRGGAQASEFTVQLSRDAGFAAAATRSLAAAESPYTVTTPLEPGTWYWRVSAPGCDPSQTWDFAQTAPVDRDTTAPVILTRLCRATTADGEVEVEVEEDAPTPPALALSTGAGRLTAARQATREGRHRFAVRPQGGAWAPGLNQVTATATDAAGNRGEASVAVVFRPVPENPVRIAPDGRYECAGTAIFPLGIYQVSPAAMPTVKAAGFELVHSYQWEGSQDDAAALEFLDAAWKNGLRVFIGFDRGNHSGQGLVQGNDAHVVRRVAALAGHPGLFCWYLFDEPEVPGQYVSARTLTRFADTIRTLDPYHPVVVTTWGSRMNSYRRSWDTHWSQSYSRPAQVVQTLQEHRKLLLNASPITFLAHCYDQKQSAVLRAGGTVAPAAFEPDAAWMRAAAFAGVTQRANGLIWWWYADGTKDYYTVARVPAAWQALCGVVAQVRELRPVLVADGSPECATVAVADGAIEVWSKRVQGERTVIAVHTGEQDVTAAIPMPGTGAVRVLFEDREVMRQGGALQDAFGRYGVHIYRGAE